MKLRYRDFVVFFFVCILIFPLYFAVKFPGLPSITAQRAVLLALVTWICCKRNLLNKISSIFKKTCQVERVFLLMYMLSVAITGARKGMNSLLNPLFDYIIPFIILFTTFYQFYGFEKLQELLNRILVVLCVLGLVEFTFNINFFDFLNTGMTKLNYGSLTRGDDLRICSAYGHALAYSMVLNMTFPLICYNTKTKKIDLLNKKLTVFLIAANALMTGSRSGIAIFIVELFLIMFLTDKKKKGNVWLYLSLLSALLVFLVFVASNNSMVQYVIRTILYVVDEVFKTNYAINYGGSSTISKSSQYREILWKILSYRKYFTFFGRGNDYKISIRIGKWFVKSIDNYYINQYLKYGLIGTITIVAFILQYVCRLAKSAFLNNTKRQISIVFLISAIGYICNLFVVDEIGTMRIMFSIMAVAEAYCLNGEEYRNG